MAPGINQGVVLQGRYVVHAMISRGGVAEVYQADDMRLRIPVALKLLGSNEPAAAAAFEREAQLLAQLRHAGIPHVTDLFMEHNRLCMVMQLIPGKDLAQLIERGGFHLGDVVRWTTSLLDVVGYLHDQRPPLVHGDVKPHNLLLATDGRLVLLDLGVSSEAGRPAALSGPSGFSAAYAAPEQLRGEALSPKTDLFAVGATIYQLVTGRAPLDAYTRLQGIAERQRDPLRATHEIYPHVPAELSQLVAQLLALDANHRPDSALRVSEQLDSLARATLASPLPARPVAPRAAELPTIHWERYQVLRRLGEGGMGEVFVARDRDRGIEVCLKRLWPTTSASALGQECAAIARLQHPGIVRLVDYKLDGEDRYMVMELVAGLTLTDYVARNAPVAAPTAVELGRRLLTAIAYAHDHEVIHCDLKPDNVILVRSGAELQPKLLDFGLAIVDRSDDRGAKTGAGRVAGTPHYMAPEQFRGEVLSGACDIYALGLMIIELLTGQPAFPSSAELHELWAVKQARAFAFDDLAQRIPGLPSAAVRALQQATAREPSQRPSARELIGALERAIPPVLPPSVWAPVPPSPAIAGAPLDGWFNSFGIVAGVSLDYEYAVESNGVLRLAAPERVEPDSFGSLMQRLPIWHLAGARLEISAQLATERVDDGAGLWVRVDGLGRSLVFDNMIGRTLRGTAPWTRCAIGFDIPAGAEWLNYGLLLSGRGTVRAANIQLVCTAGGRSWPLTLWRGDEQWSFQGVTNMPAG